jgi:DNA-binding transcriptional LysR family regulator
MAMDLSDLTVFLEVARMGSFSRAAGVLRMAQPSISTRMASLERHIGTELFVRSTRGVALTVAGQAFEPYARRCLTIAEEARHAARGSTGSQRLVMASPPSLAPVIFPPLISALAARPLEVQCRTAHSHEILEQVADGAAHIGFLLGTSVPDDIAAKHLYRVPIIWVAQPHHPLAIRGSCRVSDLGDHRLAIHYWGPDAGELEDLLRNHKIPSTQICWVSPSATAMGLASHHGYIAALPADAAAARLRSGTLVQVTVANLPTWSLDVVAAYRRGHRTSPAALALQALDITRLRAVGEEPWERLDLAVRKVDE